MFCVSATQEIEEYWGYVTSFVEEFSYRAFIETDSSEEHEELDWPLGANKRCKLQVYRERRLANDEPIVRTTPRHIENYRNRHGLPLVWTPLGPDDVPHQLPTTPQTCELMYDSDDSTEMQQNAGSSDDDEEEQ
ncbi:Hypothetical predicted protein [Cloeon dipterum]|uniref:Uncharacterized protein n=1 Tax=Cloeon dipterum TaxID=197152 RepID=A0A8S1CL20_9INSE|nr:Hypothetical predicted protein [Cloeon dipterum]